MYHEKMVGAAGIEPTTSCTPSKRAKPLRHAPKQDGDFYALDPNLVY